MQVPVYVLNCVITLLIVLALALLITSAVLIERSFSARERIVKKYNGYGKFAFRIYKSIAIKWDTPNIPPDFIEEWNSFQNSTWHRYRHAPFIAFAALIYLVDFLIKL